MGMEFTGAESLNVTFIPAIGKSMFSIDAEAMNTFPIATSKRSANVLRTPNATGRVRYAVEFTGESVAAKTTAGTPSHTGTNVISGAGGRAPAGVDEGGGVGSVGTSGGATEEDEGIAEGESNAVRVAVALVKAVSDVH